MAKYDLVWARADGTGFDDSGIDWVIDNNQLKPDFAISDAWFTMHNIAVESECVYMRLDLYGNTCYYFCAPREWWDEQQRKL